MPTRSICAIGSPSPTIGIKAIPRYEIGLGQVPSPAFVEAWALSSWRSSKDYESTRTLYRVQGGWSTCVEDVGGENVSSTRARETLPETEFELA